MTALDSIPSQREACEPASQPISSAAQRYDISTRLAVGDAGLVYKATERASGRAVALKLLLPDEQISHPLDMEGLLRDAPAISHLTGDNIVQLLDAFQDEDGTVLVYEFAEGTRGLDVPVTCPIPAAQAADVAAQLLTALSCGEVQQYPHGDLKPSDVLLVQLPNGRPLVKVLDWGLANYRKEPTPAALPYTAPERLAGDPPSHGADLFSAGAVLYYLFTGQQPVKGRSREEIATAWLMLNPHNLHHLRPDLPPALINWIARLLQPTPSHRPASAAEALGMLASVDTSLPSAAAEKIQQPPAPPQQSPQAGRRPMVLRPGLHGAASGVFPGSLPPSGFPGRGIPESGRKKRSPAVFAVGLILVAALGGGAFAFWKYTQDDATPKLATNPVTPAPKPSPAARPPEPTPKPTLAAVPKAQEPPPPQVVAAAPTPPPAPVAAPPKSSPPAATGSRGAGFSSSAEPPVVDSADIANFAAQTGTDKWFFAGSDERYGADAAKGLTFTTGDAPVLFRALTYKMATGSKKSAAPETPTTWTIRVGTLSGKDFTQIATEQVQQTADTGIGDYIAWTFATPVPLAANTTYAVDVAMLSRTEWKTGIPYLAISKNVTTPGVGFSYHSGDRGAGGASIAPTNDIDRIFHVDLQTK